MDFNLINYYRDLAINTYDVDPYIFIVLILISIPFYYYGLFVMAKVIIKLKKNHNLKGKEILKHHEFVRAFIINQVAWFGPYVYVIIWGKNIPIWIWALLIFYLSITLYIFYKKIFKKIN
ncbi:MAG: hypothetical protein WCI63_00285 [bacterium]